MALGDLYIEQSRWYWKLISPSVCGSRVPRTLSPPMCWNHSRIWRQGWCVWSWSRLCGLIDKCEWAPGSEAWPSSCACEACELRGPPSTRRVPAPRQSRTAGPEVRKQKAEAAWGREAGQGLGARGPTGVHLVPGHPEQEEEDVDNPVYHHFASKADSKEQGGTKADPVLD